MMFLILTETQIARQWPQTMETDVGFMGKRRQTSFLQPVPAEHFSTTAFAKNAADTMTVGKQGLFIFSFYFGNKHLAILVSRAVR
jgi:hypothetical protein